MQTIDEKDDVTTFRIRLSKADVLGVRALARRMSHESGADIGWCDLVRTAVRDLARTGKPGM